MPTPNRHPQRGNVLVLTMFALIPLLGFLGLAVDLGYMFNYKLRAQIAADAAALAASLTPYNPDLQPDPLAPQREAAWDIAKANGFENGISTIVVDVNTPPLQGDFMKLEPGTYFEADIKQDLPTYFMSAVGVTSFPIHVRAVAKAAGDVGSCLTVGDATFESSTKMKGVRCELFFSGTITANQGSIQAAATNKDHSIFTEDTVRKYDMELPPAPDEFPVFSCTNDRECPEESESVSPGCYRNLTIKAGCGLSPGQYNITGDVNFKNANVQNKIQARDLTFLLQGGAINILADVSLISGAEKFKEFIIWALPIKQGDTSYRLDTGSQITFQHSPGTGENRLLLVSVVTGATTNNGGDAPQITSVKFGGKSLGDPVALVKSPSAGNKVEIRVYLYMLKEIDFPTSSEDADVVVTAANSSRIFAGATSFSNVNQGNPRGVARTFSGATNSISLTVDSEVPSQLVYAVIGVDADGTSIPIIDEQTNLVPLADGLISAAISKKLGSGEVDMSWNWSGNQSSAGIAVPIIGSSITFNKGNGQEIIGNIYAPGVPINLGDKVNFSPPSSSTSSANNKPGLVE